MAGTICTTARGYLDALGELLDQLDAEAIDTLGDWLYEAWQGDQQVLLFGNGGSAYTASHYVTDIVKTAAVEGHHRLRALSLVDNFGLTTAIGNDISYDQSLAYPLASYARPGDVAIAISGSGNSPNVVIACEWAKQNGLKLACLTGFSGGKIADLADLHINIPTDNYGLLEDLHLSICHIITQRFKAKVGAMQHTG